MAVAGESMTVLGARSKQSKAVTDGEIHNHTPFLKTQSYRAVSAPRGLPGKEIMEAQDEENKEHAA